MFYSEKQYKELEEKYKKELQKLKKENELKGKEINILKQQNKQKDEIIHDLDRNNYRGQCEALKIENAEIKKITNVRRKIQSCENQLKKRQ